MYSCFGCCFWGGLSNTIVEAIRRAPSGILLVEQLLSSRLQIDRTHFVLVGARLGTGVRSSHFRNSDTSQSAQRERRHRPSCNCDRTESRSSGRKSDYSSPSLHRQQTQVKLCLGLLGLDILDILTTVNAVPVKPSTPQGSCMGTLLDGATTLMASVYEDNFERRRDSIGITENFPASGMRSDVRRGCHQSDSLRHTVSPVS